MMFLDNEKRVKKIVGWKYTILYKITFPNRSLGISKKPRIIDLMIRGFLIILWLSKLFKKELLNIQIREIYSCIFLGIKLHLEKGVINMNRQTLLKNDQYIIVQHSHYPSMKIYRKRPLTTYDIQKMLAHNKAFSLTDTLFNTAYKRVPDTFTKSEN